MTRTAQKPLPRRPYPLATDRHMAMLMALLILAVTVYGVVRGVTSIVEAVF
jgi:hypothetical protein